MTKTEILPWNHYRYFALLQPNDGIAGTVLVYGSFPTRDQVERSCLENAAKFAELAGIPFNPFNLSLIFTPTK